MSRGTHGIGEFFAISGSDDFDDNGECDFVCGLPAVIDSDGGMDFLECFAAVTVFDHILKDACEFFGRTDQSDIFCIEFGAFEESFEAGCVTDVLMCDDDEEGILGEIQLCQIFIGAGDGFDGHGMCFGG